jgi:hypothetical protein
MAIAFALVSGGMLLLAGVDGDGSYMSDVLPGMLVAGLGLGIAIFSTIAAGSSGAILGPHAASGIGHAFLIAAGVATLGSLVAIAFLPRAQHFLPKLRLNPQAIPAH